MKALNCEIISCLIIRFWHLNLPLINTIVAPEIAHNKAFQKNLSGIYKVNPDSRGPPHKHISTWFKLNRNINLHSFKIWWIDHYKIMHMTGQLCKKFGSDTIAKNGIICNWISHQIRISMEQSKSEGFDSCDQPSNLTRIGFKLLIFQPVWPWNLMDDAEKQ